MKIILILLLMIQFSFAQTQNCGSDPACFKTNAENAMKAAETSGEVEKALTSQAGLGGTAISAVSAAIPLTMGFMMLKYSATRVTSCAAPSIFAMIAGGVAEFAGNMIADSQHKSRLKKIQKEWDDLLAKGSAGGESTEGQSLAFEFLARREDSMEKAANMKATVYSVGTLAFGASAILATIETVRLDQGSLICNVTPAPAPTDVATTAVTDTATDVAEAGVEPDIVVVGKAFPALAKFLLKPLTRAVFSGVMAGYSGVMAMHAKKVAKVAKTRAEFLRKMKTQFNTGSSGTIAAATNDSAQAGSASAGLNGTGANAVRFSTDDDGFGKSCVTAAGAIDSTCACKKNNSCLQSGFKRIVGLDPQTMNVLQGGLGSVDQIGDGTFGNASIDADAASQKAVRLMDAASKLAAKSKNGLELNHAKPALAGNLNSQLGASGRGLSSSASAPSSSLPLSHSAASMLEKEIPKKKSEPTVVSDNSVVTTVAPATPSVSEELALNEGQKVDEMMKEDFDYKTDDVHNIATDSIFDVLSNRYQQSGRRRLLTE